MQSKASQSNAKQHRAIESEAMKCKPEQSNAKQSNVVHRVAQKFKAEQSNANKIEGKRRRKNEAKQEITRKFPASPQYPPEGSS